VFLPLHLLHFFYKVNYHYNQLLKFNRIISIFRIQRNTYEYKVQVENAWNKDQVYLMKDSLCEFLMAYYLIVLQIVRMNDLLLDDNKVIENYPIEIIIFGYFCQNILLIKKYLKIILKQFFFKREMIVWITSYIDVTLQYLYY
jgi:hypothetical protein